MTDLAALREALEKARAASVELGKTNLSLARNRAERADRAAWDAVWAELAKVEAERDRQQARSLACVHALKSALAFANERKAVCERARDKYKAEKPNDPYYAASEQCAAHEARHIAEKIAELLKEVDRDFRRARPSLQGNDHAD